MAKLIIDQALSFIHSGARVFVHGCGATPQYLNRLLANRAGDLRRVEIISVNPLDDTFTNPELKDSFFVNSLFASYFVRSAIANGDAAYIPAFLNEMPRLFDEKILPLDAALIQVSPPDKHGYCSLGISVEVTRAAVRNAKKVFAQINRNMPRVHGDTFVHIDEIDAYVEYDEPLIELNYTKKISQVEKTIGRRVAELIEDQSTLQLGLGPIPDSILSCLDNHKDLSIATEMLSDGVLPLLESGVITNQYKKFYPGKTTCTFMLGTKKFCDFVDDNPDVLSLDVSITNDPALIRRNPRMCAINSALEIDLTGQICADSLGTMQYSGVGGQMDFMRGAALSEHGKPIVVLPSQSSKGNSRIVNTLKEGAAVTTTRAHVHYVVTEYGVVNLFGKNCQQRAKALIGIAHPNHREALERAAYKRFKALTKTAATVYIESMTKPTVAELQHEFDKRLKSYTGTNEVSDLWLPFLVAIQDTFGENALVNNQILYPICIKCLEKFENDSEQVENKDFTEICLLIPDMSVDKGLWYGLFYKKHIGVKYAHLWIHWAEYTEEHERNWAGAWGIYEEAKKFVTDPDECAEIDRAYRAFATRFQQWDQSEYDKEQSTKKKPQNRTTVTKRTTQTRSSFQVMMAAEPKTKRSPVKAPIQAQLSLDTDDDPDCQLLPECREAVRLEYSRMLDMSNTSLLGGERVSCMPSNLQRGSIVPPLMNIFTIDQVLRRQSHVPIDDTLDENFLNVSCIVVDERDPFDDHIRRQILEKRGVNYPLMESYSVEKSNLPSVLAKNKIGTKIEKVKLGGTTYEFGKKLGEGAYGYVITARLESDPKVTYACKIQHPPTVWEFYILTELSRRTIRKAGQFDLNQRIPTVYRLIEYNDYSVMFMQRAPQTLLDFANYHISRDRYVPLCYQLYYSIEMLRIFDYMHRLRIIHCDVKPDNFMVLHCPTSFSTKKDTCGPIPSLMLIDFNRSIDLKLFDNGTAFVTCVPKKELACVEMLNNRPWIFQHDLFGMVYSIHVLVFLSYMTVCEDEQRQDGTMTTKAKFSKRIHDVWKEFFNEFLNIPDCQHLPDLSAWADRLEVLLFEEAKRIKLKDTEYTNMFRMKLDTHLNQFQPTPPTTQTN